MVLGSWLLAQAAGCEGIISVPEGYYDEPQSRGTVVGADDLGVRSDSWQARQPGGDAGIQPDPRADSRPASSRDSAPPPRPRRPPPAKRHLSVSQVIGNATLRVTQGYGYTSYNYDYSYCRRYGHWQPGRNVHCAIDIGITRGSPLYAAGDATVVTAGGTPYFRDDQNTSAGELRLKLDDGSLLIYGHTSAIAVRKGQRVNRGQLIGKSGTSGGAHLHLELRLPDSSCSSGYCTKDPLVVFGR